ncbi:recombinase family protein [Amnibacterium endophyticum]|uniref:Recombinase family protein n=1 Tax=Amnibacterium endophyticum TaxID=2109337 RepID=A0ABW4LDQ3_9MICO
MAIGTSSPPGRRFGYVRVSKASQDEAGQIKVLMERGSVQRKGDLFIDRGVSGAKASRPELDRMLATVEPNDTVVLFKLDRLGRSSGHTILLIEDLVKRNIHVESVVDGLNTRTTTGMAMLSLLAIFASMERSFLIERTRAGLDAAAQSGRRGGRPAALTAEQIDHAQEMHDKGKSASAIASYFKVSRSSVYRALGRSSA